MIDYLDMDPDEALDLVRETRPRANPNECYAQELQDYYDMDD
jgi:hypothetical protein